jgi:rubredoxin
MDATGWQCVECEAISEETGGPLYECPECGSVFSRENSYADNHQCPDDRRFSSKVADEACSVCGKAEVEQIEVLTCAVADCRSDDLFDQDGFLDHLRDEHGYRLDD